MAEAGKKPRQFRAEVRKVLHILTNSLYTNREIFLRELISNASDALDKLRFRVNRGESPKLPDLPLEIRITLDKDAKTLTIADTGLGMTAEELAENLGTIAKSGSEQFLADIAAENAAKAKSGNGRADDSEEGEEAVADAANIIGRFGVGFYSVFMVANKVAVTSRPAFGDDDAAHTWASDGLGTYTVTQSDEAEPARGTVIKAWLKDDAVEFLEKFRVESAIRKHSAFVPFPVFVDGEQANTQPALWREPKFSITKEQYAAFYKALTYDSADPLDELHFSVDAPVQFNALLFIPNSAQDFFGSDRDFWGLDLYARRVLIQHRNKELIPEYLAFLKGVVDTEDLPLNISRETLQENVVLRKISQVIVKQTLNHLEKLARDDAEKYSAFWRLHGKVFKLGYHDFANRERITALLRFNSSTLADAEALTSLDGYMERAPEGQKTFWFVAAPNREAARLNPHMERFRQKGIEVLYLYEPIDEFVMDGLGRYKEWEFKSVEAASDDALKDFADKEEPAREAVSPLSDEDSTSFESLLARMKEVLGDKVTDVRVSHRLADSPAVLVSPDGGMSSSMEKLLKVMQKDDSLPVKVLEVNRDHPLLRNMLRMFKADRDDKTLAEMTQGLFDASLLLDGYLKDPQALAARTNKLLEEAAAWYTEVRKI
ncbi:molecular chaperone HtpG [Desulfovibrio sp. 86]|uniref:Chaperone protein HtpG n=1 Tax=uncultured Desulfovibrio sp. TaxID=167968 RepID=A0A212L457_9BACT|nr:molecular chaperone HtpG [Desulfovibrio sp. 86]SCM72305.1 Chaperone protein HtpG [uncultured Desulfovibrio sp.]VZH33425.1 Chaperone protein HtpG [Desulfovibrio sp. 86]